MELICGLAKLKVVENETHLSSHRSSPDLLNPDFITIPSRSAILSPPKDFSRAAVTAVAGLGVWFSSVLFILLVPTAFLLPYLFLHDPPFASSELMLEFAKSDPTAIFLQIAAVIPAHLLTIIVAWFVVSRRNKFSFLKTLGWDGGGVRMWMAYPAILIGFFAVAYVVSAYFPEQDNELLRMLRSSRSALYITAFLATFTAPFVEEVVYRGVLYSSFQRLLGSPASFLIVTFLFALVHVPQYYPSYSTIFLLVLLSLTLTTIRVKTNNLLPCIILHTLFNGIQSVGLLLQPLSNPTDVVDPAAFIIHLMK